VALIYRCLVRPTTHVEEFYTKFTIIFIIIYLSSILLSLLYIYRFYLWCTFTYSLVNLPKIVLLIVNYVLSFYL